MPDAKPWVCEVCLDEPEEPVVTPCGHLFCWRCVWRWLETDHDTCPVCKAGITKERLIPVYGKGKQRRESGIPSRPVPERREAPSQQDGGGAWNAPNNVHFGLGFGFFPALFVGLWTHHTTGRMHGDFKTRLMSMTLNTMCVILGLWIVFG